MKEKKKGFTLVELLAVIVILALIALIATPIILNVIENAKKESYKESAKGYIDAVEKTIISKKLKNDSYNYTGTYSISKNEITKDNSIIKVKIKGQLPDSGSLIINDKGVTSGTFNYGDYTVTLSDNNYTVTALNSSNSSIVSSENYSTEEKLIGKWIDGKNLYRKTIVYSSSINSNTVTSIGKIDNMKEGFIDTSASYFVNNNSEMTAIGSRIPVVVSGRNVSTSTYTVYTVVTSDGYINTYFGSKAKASSMVVTVSYTKTTD